MGIQLPEVLQSWSSYDQLHIRIALFGRNVDINVVSASLALLFIFLISRIKLFLKGLNVSTGNCSSKFCVTKVSLLTGRELPSGPAGSVPTSRSAWCCSPYHLVESRSQISMGMAIYMYVHFQSNIGGLTLSFLVYKQFRSENVSVVPFISGVPGIYTSNLDVGRQVISGGHKSSFIKPETASQALL